jgi:hypothetical protein
MRELEVAGLAEGSRPPSPEPWHWTLSYQTKGPHLILMHLQSSKMEEWIGFSVEYTPLMRDA